MLPIAITIEGTLLKVKLQRADGWSPGDFLLSEISGGNGKPINAVGQWLGVEPGARVRLLGEWSEHPKFGKQFKFTSCEPLELDTVDDLAAFLAYRIDEIGEFRARQIKEKFGDTLQAVLETEPVKLAEIRGISERIALKVGAAFKAYKAEYELLRGLQKWGLTSLVRKKALREWGIRATTVLEEDPFNLMVLDGVSFIIADKARELAGIATNDIRRLRAAATCYQSTKIESDGSTWCDYQSAVSGVAELARCSMSEAAAGLDGAIAKGDLCLHQIPPPPGTTDLRRYASPAVFSGKAFLAESQITAFVMTAKSQRERPPAPPKESPWHEMYSAVEVPGAFDVEVVVDAEEGDEDSEPAEDTPAAVPAVPVVVDGSRAVAVAASNKAPADLPRLIRELADSDPVVKRLVTALEEPAEAEALFEAVRMELDNTLRAVRDSLLDYLRDGDESAKERFSLMVERLTAIAVVSCSEEALKIFGAQQLAQLSAPAPWRAE